MENDYIITCTSACDLDRVVLTKNNIECFNYKYLLNDVEYDDDYYQSKKEDSFYNDLKSGAVIKTSQIGFGRYLELFEKYLKQGKNIIHVGLSSGITGDTQVAMAVARELNEKYSNKVYVLESTCASSGYGMLVLRCGENKKNGLSFDDNIKDLEDFKYKIHHWFISSDLSFYVKGGRISNVEGFFGKALKICPLLYVDRDGKLTPYEKIRTKQRSLEAQVDKMEEYCDKGLDYDDKVFISNSLCFDDAELLSNMIKERFHKVKDVNIYSIGPSIGAHTGPNTVSLFFVGKNRGEIRKED